MVKTLSTALVCGVVLIAQSYAQEIFVGEQKAKPKYPKAEVVSTTHTKPASSVGPVEKAIAIQPAKTNSGAKPTSASKPALAQTAKAPAEAHIQPAPVRKAAAVTGQTDKALAKTKAPIVETITAKSAVAPPAEGPRHGLATHLEKKVAANSQNAPIVKNASVGSGALKKEVVETKPPTPAPKVAAVAARPTKGPGEGVSIPPKTAPEKSAVAISTPPKKPVVTTKAPAEIHSVVAVSMLAPSRKELAAPVKSPTGQTVLSETKSAAADTPVVEQVNAQYDTAFTKLADGFDFPVGKPNAQGYYKARGFRSHGHLGEDWDGVRGGDTDLGDPIYSIGDGLVVFARDCHMGWGNVLIVRHSYREGGTVKTVDALYGHLNNMLVHRGQAVARGQKIATMGNAHGLYDAHLHLEVRKNLEIGMSRAAFAQDFSNYYDPTQFIEAHRHLQAGGGSYRVAMNTFTRDGRIRWDKTRNYSHKHTGGGGTSESAAALKRALAAKR